MRRLRYALPLLAALAACHEANTHELAVRMDSTAYGRDTAGVAHAGFVLVNTGTAPVYLQGCADPVAFDVEGFGSGHWSVVGANGTRCIASIAPATQAIYGGGSARGAWAADSAGWYRLAVYFGPTPEDAFAYQVTGPAFQIR